MTESEKQRIQSIYKENEKLREENKEMKHAMKEFIFRVEAGEVKSVYTYNQFKTVLKFGKK